MKDFNYYKQWAINHLKKQLRSEEIVTKSLEYCEQLLQKSFPVGTVREWKGKKYKKVAPGKWMRYYNSQNRGSAQALQYAIKQLEKIEDIETLAKFINVNRNRFCNEYGKPLPEAMDILRFGKGKSLMLKKERVDASILNNPEQTSETFLPNKNINLENKKVNKKNEKNVKTKYDNYEKQKEATDSINAVIAKYRYTPESIIVKNQVGAVLSSLKPNLSPEKEVVKENTKKSVKTECKSISDLKRYARENYNIDIVYNSSANTEEDQCINSFYEVEKMCKKLPGLNEYIKTIEYENIGTRNNGLYDPNDYKIKIGNFQKNAEYEDFRFATGQDVVTVMQHEMTHAIQQYIFLNHDEEDFKDMFENSKLGDKYIKRHRARHQNSETPFEDYKKTSPESFNAHKYKFYQSKVNKELVNKVFKNLGMKPVKFGTKQNVSYYVEKNPETGKYRYKKDSFTPEELAVLKISFYALSDPGEFWSEAFTDYLQNGENAQPISKELWKVVNEDYLKGELRKSFLYMVKSILGEYVA